MMCVLSLLPPLYLTSPAMLVPARRMGKQSPAYIAGVLVGWGHFTGNVWKHSGGSTATRMLSFNKQTLLLACPQQC